MWTYSIAYVCCGYEQCVFSFETVSFLPSHSTSICSINPSLLLSHDPSPPLFWSTPHPVFLFSSLLDPLPILTYLFLQCPFALFIPCTCISAPLQLPSSLSCTHKKSLLHLSHRLRHSSSSSPLPSHPSFVTTCPSIECAFLFKEMSVPTLASVCWLPRQPPQPSYF